MCVYVPSEHCTRTQRAFLRAHGHGKNVLKNPDLPRRQLKPRVCKGETLQSLKRKREQQLDDLVQADDIADVAELQAVTAEASTARRGERHEKLAKSLKSNAESRDDVV